MAYLRDARKELELDIKYYENKALGNYSEKEKIIISLINKTNLFNL